MNELTNEDLQLVRNWRNFQTRIKAFENKANLSLFKEIYDNDGERLIDNFVNKCNKNYLVFETYLTKEQLNNTLIFILKKIIL